MDESRRLIKNTGIIAIGNLSTRLISFLLLPLYTALLTKSEYGNMDYIVTIATFCVPFVSLLMDESIFRFLIDCKTDEDRNSVITNSVIICICGIIVFSALGIPIMRVLHYEYTYYATIYIVLIVIQGMVSALLRGTGRTDQFALFNFIAGALQIVLNVLFIAVFHLGLKGMLYAALLSRILCICFFVIRFKLWVYLHFKRIDINVSKEMVKYSLPLIPNKISWTIINLSDRIIIMNILGSDATGVYAVAHKFPNLMDTIYGFFYQSWKESSARVVSTSDQDVFYNFVYHYLCRFMASIVLLMTAFMPLVFKIMINTTYSEAILYVPILLLATYFSNMSGFYGGIFTAYKDTGIMGITTVVAALINLIVHFVLISKVGMYAAAVSTLLANIVVFVYRRIKTEKYVHLKEDKFYIISFLICISIVFSMFYSQKWPQIVLSCGVSVCYAFVMNYKLIQSVVKKMKN